MKPASDFVRQNNMHKACGFHTSEILNMNKLLMYYRDNQFNNFALFV
jgi:hypothetical protein